MWMELGFGGNTLTPDHGPLWRGTPLELGAPMTLLTCPEHVPQMLPRDEQRISPNMDGGAPVLA